MPAFLIATLILLVRGTSAEPVRLRESDGRMTCAKLLSVDGAVATIQNRDRVEEHPVRALIGHPLGGPVWSPRFQYYWSATHLMPTAPVIRFLDAGARVFARPAPDLVARVWRTLEFLHAHLEYHGAVAADPPPDFDPILAGGRAGCLHFTALTAAILSEAGVSVRFVTGFLPSGVGHAWLELEASDPRTSRVHTYVVDPSGPSITRWSELPKTGDPAFTRDFYMNAGRIYHDLR